MTDFTDEQLEAVYLWECELTDGRGTMEKIDVNALVKDLQTSEDIIQKLVRLLESYGKTGFDHLKNGSCLTRAIEALRQFQAENEGLRERERIVLAMGTDSLHIASDELGRLYRENDELRARVERMDRALESIIETCEICAPAFEKLNLIHNRAKAARPK